MKVPFLLSIVPLGNPSILVDVGLELLLSATLTDSTDNFYVFGNMLSLFNTVKQCRTLMTDIIKNGKNNMSNTNPINLFLFPKYGSVMINDKLPKNIISAICYDLDDNNEKVLEDISGANPDINSLQFIACDLRNINFKLFPELKELHLLYSLDETENIQSILEGLSLRKLVISSDLLTTPENKTVIGDLRKKGVKVEIQGPKI